MTREEAIRRIKAWNLDSDDMEVLAVVIPELKESEDERTRKEIINFLRSPFVNENITDEKVAPWITWLEKQKEQEHICDSAQFEEGFKTGLEIGLRKQKERKQEWSEKDSLHLKNAILSAEKEWGNESCTATWLKSIPERFNLSPKPTWSEEERKILDSIIDDYEAAAKSFCGYDGKIGLLRAIRDGEYGLSKQEWSEEDEKIVKSIINYLSYNGTQAILTVEIDKWIAWLKSLRSQPKAELTLLDKNIIEAAVAFVEQNNHFSYWGGIDKHTVIKALRSLKPYGNPVRSK